MHNRERLLDFEEWLHSPPSGGKFQMWGVGGVAALMIFVKGLQCCWAGHATTINMARNMGRFWLEIGGAAAYSQGALLMFLAGFMHFQWFWGNHPTLVRYYEIGKYLSFFGAAISFILHLYFVYA